MSDKLLQETHDAVLEIKGKLDAYTERTETLEDAVFGKGREGLKTRVTILEERSRWTSKWSLAIVAAVATVLAATIDAAVQAAIAWAR